MGYFNPITYFIKSFIRLFTRKFFWVLLILILLFVGFLLYDKGVFAAAYSYSFYQADNEFYCSMNEEQLECLKQIPEFYDEDVSAFSFYRGNENTVNVVFFDSYNGAYVVYRKPNIVDFPVNSPRFRLYIIRYENGNWVLANTTPSVWTYYQWNWENFIVNGKYFFKNLRVGIDWTLSDEYIQHYQPVFINPEITNSSNDISGLTFDTLDIQLNSADFPTNSLRTLLNVKYTAEDENQFTIDVSKYANASDYSLHIPRIELIKNMVLSTSFNMSFTLLYADTVGNVSSYYNLGSYNISITADYMTTLNELAEKDTQNNIENNTDKTSQGIENINNSITDSNIDDITSSTLPSDNTTDITSDGVNGIFTSIYNAFCTGNAVDIIFPFPFTNKSITLSPTYVRDNLTNINATFVITLIEAFWWYLISRFIIKDVMNKINKIKSGNVEDIETTNIRGDML